MQSETPLTLPSAPRGSSLYTSMRFQLIPKGLCPPAQGCEERETLGCGEQKVATPTGLWPPLHVEVTTPLGLAARRLFSQGSSCLATLGYKPESLWDSCLLEDVCNGEDKGKGCRLSQLHKYG